VAGEVVLETRMGYLNHYVFRPRLGKPAGIEVRYVGESCEGVEIASKNRICAYVRNPLDVDRLHRLLAILRQRHIDSTICAVDCGVGRHGIALFSLTPVKARRAVLKIAQQEIDGTAQL
jgi:hypothetical protein